MYSESVWGRSFGSAARSSRARSCQNVTILGHRRESIVRRSSPSGRRALTRTVSSTSRQLLQGELEEVAESEARPFDRSLRPPPASVLRYPRLTRAETTSSARTAAGSCPGGSAANRSAFSASSGPSAPRSSFRPPGPRRDADVLFSERVDQFRGRDPGKDRGARRGAMPATPRRSRKRDRSRSVRNP